MSDDNTEDNNTGTPINGGVFMGSRDPKWTLEHERPWHRLAAYFFAMGDSVSNVALKLDKSQPAVHNLLRQQWFQKMVTQLMADAGGKDINKLFKGEQYNNYSTLVQMRDNPSTPAAIKFKCAQDMLDRSMGRATQRVEMSREVVSDDPVQEYERLEQENNRLRNEIKKQQP
jgi:hypothetical protein